jgi:hypothetical protein
VQVNDPLLDAQLTLDLFNDQNEAFLEIQRTSPDLMCAWHWLTTAETRAAGVNSLFTTLRQSVRPIDSDARAALGRLLRDRACITRGREVVRNAHQYGWSLAYTLAWLSVSGGNSVMPPWVRHQFPQAGELVRNLRDVPCADPACGWCRERHDAALTVVISPLVALMSDQVTGLEARGITCAAALNGLLSMPERSDVLDRVRLLAEAATRSRQPHARGPRT